METWGRGNAKTSRDRTRGGHVLSIALRRRIIAAKRTRSQSVAAADFGRTPCPVVKQSDRPPSNLSRAIPEDRREINHSVEPMGHQLRRHGTCLPKSQAVCADYSIGDGWLALIRLVSGVPGGSSSCYVHAPESGSALLENSPEFGVAELFDPDVAPAPLSAKPCVRQHHIEVAVSRPVFFENVTYLRELVAPSRLCVVLKSNAYGHGLAALRPSPSPPGPTTWESARIPKRRPSGRSGWMCRCCDCGWVCPRSSTKAYSISRSKSKSEHSARPNISRLLAAGWAATCACI